MITIKQEREREKEKFPVIYKVGSDRTVQYFLSLDLELIEIQGNITVAIRILMESFFCFNLKYPRRAQIFYRLLENTIGIKTLIRAPVFDIIIAEIQTTSCSA